MQKFCATLIKVPDRPVETLKGEMEVPVRSPLLGTLFRRLDLFRLKWVSLTVLLIVVLSCRDGAVNSLNPFLFGSTAPELSRYIYKIKHLKGDAFLEYARQVQSEEVVWDGKSKFKSGVRYVIPRELMDRAAEVDENFARLFGGVRKAQEKYKKNKTGKKSDQP